MNYYLYSKFLNPNIEELMSISRIHKAKYPSVTKIAVYSSSKNFISFALDEFANKYIDGGSYSVRWCTSTKEQRRAKFEEFVRRYEDSEDHGNNFGIIAHDGTKYEPIEFIEYVKQFNKGTNDKISA